MIWPDQENVIQLQVSNLIYINLVLTQRSGFPGKSSEYVNLDQSSISLQRYPCSLTQNCPRISRRQYIKSVLSCLRSGRQLFDCVSCSDGIILSLIVQMLDCKAS